MKFTVSTQPLKNVTDLGIIKKNISNTYYRSSIVQITATRDTLTLNIEAYGIKTQMSVKGSGDSDTTSSIIVGCSTFKSLIDSIDSNIVTLEFADGGLFVHAGNSKFAMAQILDVNDMQLESPMTEYQAESTINITPESWKFIKDHQVFAISNSVVHPVYQNIWVSETNEVIVGDYDNSLFTYSKKGNFGATCLIPTSLLNLFVSIPTGSTISKVDDKYILNINTDSYDMVTEFVPKYEDEANGNYNAQFIINMLAHPDTFATITISPILKFLNQTALVAADVVADKSLSFNVSDSTLTISNKHSEFSMPVEDTTSYIVNFNYDLLKSVLSNFDVDTVSIAPLRRGDVVIGCILWSENLTVLLAAQAS